MRITECVCVCVREGEREREREREMELNTDEVYGIMRKTSEHHKLKSSRAIKTLRFAALTVPGFKSRLCPKNYQIRRCSIVSKSPVIGFVSANLALLFSTSEAIRNLPFAYHYRWLHSHVLIFFRQVLNWEILFRKGGVGGGGTELLNVFFSFGSFFSPNVQLNKQKQKGSMEKSTINNMTHTLSHTRTRTHTHTHTHARTLMWVREDR